MPSFHNWPRFHANLYHSTPGNDLRILLIGKNGQVGAELVTVLARLGEVFAFDRSQLDLSNPTELRNAIRDVHPNVLVNAAAYTAVDQAEKEPSQARLINTEAPGVMAIAAKEIGALLVHYSTDYVFDGTKNAPYLETDHTNPLSVYGQTKLDGELAIQESGVEHLIFRTAWVYGTRGRNFLLTILRLSTEREELRIVGDQIGAPTWCREIARGTTDVLSKIFSQPTRRQGEVRGLYNMTASGQGSWLEFTEAIIEEASDTPKGISWLEKATAGKEIMTRRIIPITTAEYPTPARRPAYSVLSNVRLEESLGVRLSPWREQLRAVFREGHSPAD
jgi:dTDP-4-dehydrorhamnose reductase